MEEDGLCPTNHLIPGISAGVLVVELEEVEFTHLVNAPQEEQVIHLLLVHLKEITEVTRIRYNTWCRSMGMDGGGGGGATAVGGRLLNHLQQGGDGGAGGFKLKLHGSACS